jgi:hypothetical protein
VPLVSTLSSSPATTLNSRHLELFHHFEKYTQKSLLFPPDVWGNALQLCSEHEFLKNAVLCISARHLAFLQPENAKYPAVAASHLYKTISQLREELSKRSTSIHPDAFIATSFLLQLEIWTNTEFARDGVFDPSGEHFFTFNLSLKKVFLEKVSLLSNRPSVFLPKIQYNPMLKLIEQAQISTSTIGEFQTFFSRELPYNAEMFQPVPYKHGTVLANPWGDHRKETSGYESVINHICLILSFLPEAGTDDTTLVLPELTRYIASFPLISGRYFAEMVHRRDPHSLLLLYHFYRAVRILLPADQCWWAQKRAAVSEIILKECLMRECVKEGKMI